MDEYLHPAASTAKKVYITIESRKGTPKFELFHYCNTIQNIMTSRHRDLKIVLKKIGGKKCWE